MLDSKQKTSGETADLRGGLEAADPATLLLALVQLTGERHWLEEAKPYIRGSMTHLLLHKTPNLVSSEPGPGHYRAA